MNDRCKELIAKITETLDMFMTGKCACGKEINGPLQLQAHIHSLGKHEYDEHVVTLALTWK